MTLTMVPMDAARAYPPRVSAFTEPFWSGLAQGHWRTVRCASCSKATFPPKPVCPHCWSTQMEWVDLQPKGAIYSWTRVHAAPAVFAGEAPYACGIVDLEDGLRIACRIVAPPEQALTIGAAVDIVVLQYSDGPLFAARPRSQAKDSVQPGC
jgi:uncharacterized OB-fold protein